MAPDSLGNAVAARLDCDVDEEGPTVNGGLSEGNVIEAKDEADEEATETAEVVVEDDVVDGVAPVIPPMFWAIGAVEEAGAPKV